ncbi:MAG: hypothetical protein NXI23_05540 [Bacteroidetes bacterium]|jgi:hypothetical protein|nr:hypothetical protein [Bacteroidota bacterium]MDF1863826.1 hypothetical protein [Saprospiraceae bacterium]
MVRITFFIFAFIFSYSVHSQTIGDAVRYSLYDVGGTARTVGVGGALGALGADFSVLSTNPAGLATYRKSEFMFTPTINLSNVKAELAGSQNDPVELNKTKFNLNNLGLVIAKRPYDSKWTTSNFGVGLNRVANFHQEIRFEGTSPGSITDRFLELADGKNINELGGFEEGLAYDAFAIYDDASGNYFSDFFPEEEVEKEQFIRRTGSINELVFSFAGNYNEKLMLGATVGIPIVNFEETKTYREIDFDDSNPVFDELAYIESLTTTGAGINLKLGAIYRINQMFRVGAAIHTPTSFAFEDSWNARMLYEFTDPDFSSPGEQQSPDGFFEYKFKTPWRYIGSLGVIIKKYGFLSADIEYVNYGGSEFKFNNTENAEDLDFVRGLNNQLSDELKGGVNLRLGGEFAYEILRFRAGFSITDNPYDNVSEKNNALSLGIGVRGKTVFADFAFKRIMNESEYTPYVTNSAPQSIVNIDDQRNKLMLTVGFKF